MRLTASTYHVEVMSAPRIHVEPASYTFAKNFVRRRLDKPVRENGQPYAPA